MNKTKFDFAVGGQAVIEGVMMRSKNFIAIACRNPKGEIVIKDFPFTSIVSRKKWLNIPIIRGFVGMIEMLGVGIRALNFSADVFAEESTEGDLPEKTQTKKQKLIATFLLVLNVLVSLAFAVLIFDFVPLYFTEFVNKYFPYLAEKYVLYNMVDAVFKMLIFIVYILLISLSKPIYRVFEYHGAEHKAVFNYEAGTELNVKNSQMQSRIHPRCGTSFVIFVFLISIFIYSLVPRNPDIIFQFLNRVTLLPLIAGTSYEVLKYSANHMDSRLVKLFTYPGRLFQKLTTKEPDDAQVEVALAALNRTLELENAKNKN